MKIPQAPSRGRLLGPSGARRLLLINLLLMITLTTAHGAQDGPPYRVAVVDMFWSPEVAEADQGALIAADATDIDGDGLRDNIYHGDLVSLFMAADGVESVPFPVRDPSHPKEEILARLGEVLARSRSGEDFSAVMLCWESSTLISSIDRELSPEKRGAYKEIVRQWGLEDESWRLSYEIILGLEALSEAGILVVTIAGNSGPAWVNTYTFAEDVLVIGAVEPDPDGEWATSNALIDDYAQSRYTVRLVSDRERPAYGYDIDEDGVADIPLRRGSSWYRSQGTLRDGRRVLSGTSFAAPTALKRLVLSRGR